MMKVSLAKEMAEWDGLIAAVGREEELQQPHLQELRDELEKIRQMTRTLMIEQQDLEGRRRAVTQQLRLTRGRGQDIAIRLKGAIKGQFGHRYEGLGVFHIRPIRKRSRRVPEEVGISHFPVPEDPVGSDPTPEESGAPHREE
ncbi:MAG TPA: hypothetical protein VGG03_21100 [Thermoanaerobaculia bacterium]|jgi:hypothetical protein